MSKIKDELEREKKFADKELEAIEPKGEAEPDYEEEHQGRSYLEEQRVLSDFCNSMR